ncbi:MAG TPA: EamA family transporter [Ktedonobacterales bacterium]
MATGVAFGLFAAVCWGIADFCIRGATHAAGSFRTLYFDQLVALLFFAVVIEPWTPLSFARTTPLLALAAAGLNLVILVGAALLYRAFAVGSLSVVSPIAASFGAVVTSFALTFSGERPSVAQLGGIAVTLVGVTLAGMHSDGQRLENAHGSKRKLTLGKGVPEALLATGIFGVTYWALRYVTPVMGGAQVALVGKITDIIALTIVLAVAFAWRRFAEAPARSQSSATGAMTPFAPRGWRFWVWIVPAGALDIAANIAYNIGVASALTSIVVTISSLFSAITVVLAWIFLRERLSARQWAGVALILAGIVLVNI